MFRSGRSADANHRGVWGLILAAAACAAATFSGPSAIAQNIPTDSADRARFISTAREIITAARYATLTTISEEGHPQARVVDPFEPDADFTIWVGTNRLTRKVSEITADPRVTLLYFNADAGEYATVVGVATIVSDSAERVRRWKDEWSAFYDGGPLGEQYVLIRVRPERLEVVSPERGILNEQRTWRPPQVEFRNP